MDLRFSLSTGGKVHPRESSLSPELAACDGRTTPPPSDLARLGSGQFFGEVAMLDGRSRTADVVAGSRLRCIALSRETVKRALRTEPDLAWRVLEGWPAGSAAERSNPSPSEAWTRAASGRILES
jgi:CRP-like cAMP-binding protein